MDILKLTKSIFSVDNLSLSERIRILQMDLSIKKENIPSFENLMGYYNSFKKRDSITITFKDPDENQLCINNYNFQISKYDDFLIGLENDDCLNIKIYIDKKISNGYFSVYNEKAFYEDLINNSVYDIMLIFNDLLMNQEHLNIEILDNDNIFWCTKSLSFIHDENIKFKMDFNRKERLDNCLSNLTCNTIGEIQLLPDDFKIVTDYAGNPFTETFNKISTVLSLLYISSSSIITYEKFESQIIGYKSVSYTSDLENIVSNKEIYKIYDWIYSGGNPIDKLLIARNLLSLHCRLLSIVEINESTFLSIKSNYQMYLKDNVSQYLDAKNNVAKYISEVSSKVCDNVTKLASDYKKNLIAILVFLLTVVLVNIVSEQPLENIFNAEITRILETILFGSFIYGIFCIGESIYKYNGNKIAYDNLKLNYHDVFAEFELNKIFNNDKIFNESKKKFKKGIILNSLLFLTLLIVFFIALENIGTNAICSPMLDEIKIFIHNISEFFVSNSFIN